MNKSEELCKLLGIEPNWVNITCKGLECKNKCNLFVLPSDKCRKIEKGEPCQHIYRYKEIYPDLTKPSNFMKLLDIILRSLEEPHNFIILTGLDVNNSISDKITQYIDFLSRETLMKFKLIQQAQQIEWEY